MKKLSLASPKPLPVGRPLVWADGARARFDFCESAPYFRSFKSSEHEGDGFAISFLHDGGAGEGDSMDSDCILSHAGGGLTEGDNDNGHETGDSKTPGSKSAKRKMSRKKDQANGRQQVSASFFFPWLQIPPSIQQMWQH